MALDVPVTLVPLDATNDVTTPTDIVQLLDADHAAAGADIAFETYIRSPYLATEGNYWWDAMAAAALADPGLLEWEDMNVRHGRRVCSGSHQPGCGWPPGAGSHERRRRRGARSGPRQPAPRRATSGAVHPVGTVDATWDGTTCRVEGMPAGPGLIRIDFHNRSSTPASLLGPGVRSRRRGRTPSST